MGADNFTDASGDGRPSINGGLDGCDIAGDNGIAKTVADLFHGAEEFDVCGFEHCVNADDEAGEAAGFQKSYCLFGHIGMWWG